MLYPKGSKQPKQVWASVMNVYKEPETTPAVTPSPTPTNTPSGTPAVTPSPTQTQTGTPNPTSTPTNTPTGTAAVTPTPTPSGTASVTPTPTPSATPPASGTTQAQAYLSAVVAAGGTGITPTVSAATITMFTSLVSNGLYNGMIAMYPFIGGNASGHKFNALNPLDTNGAYRLTFNGGWTHSSSGATPNGTNGWAQTYLNPFNIASLTLSGGCGGTYCGTNGPQNGVVFGGAGAGRAIGRGDSWMLYPMYSFGAGDNRMFASFWENDPYVNSLTGITNSLGLMAISRTGTTNVEFYRRGALVSSRADTSNAKTNISLGLAARTTDGDGPYEYSTYRQQFTFIHTGMTASQMSTLDGIIQTYQTSLGRNVY
jgi:hypothetical protein